MSKLQKHTLNLRAGDFKQIAEAFPTKGAAYVIRTLVTNFIKNSLDKNVENIEDLLDE